MHGGGDQVEEPEDAVIDPFIAASCLRPNEGTSGPIAGQPDEGHVVQLDPVGAGEKDDHRYLVLVPRPSVCRTRRSKGEV